MLEPRTQQLTPCVTVLAQQLPSILKLTYRQPHILRAIITYEQHQELEFIYMQVVSLYAVNFGLDLVVNVYRWCRAMQPIAMPLP